MGVFLGFYYHTDFNQKNVLLGLTIFIEHKWINNQSNVTTKHILLLWFHALFYSSKQTLPASQPSWSMSRRRTRRRRIMRRRRRWKRTAASRTTTVLLWPQVFGSVPIMPLFQRQPSHQLVSQLLATVSCPSSYMLIMLKRKLCRLFTYPSYSKME